MPHPAHAHALQVELWTQPQHHVHSSVKKNRRNPKWRKQTLEVLVQEPDSQILRVVMHDIDILNPTVSSEGWGGGGECQVGYSVWNSDNHAVLCYSLDLLPKLIIFVERQHCAGNLRVSLYDCSAGPAHSVWRRS
jgi:hypothetical protein